MLSMTTLKITYCSVILCGIMLNVKANVFSATKVNSKICYDNEIRTIYKIFDQVKYTFTNFGIYKDSNDNMIELR